MITLYGKFAPRTSRIYWILEELALDYEVVPIDYTKGDTRDPEYLATNPAGKIPALRCGDLVITESYAILLYLAQRFGAGGLWPVGDDHAVAKTLQWTLWAATEQEPPAMTRLIQSMYKGAGAPAQRPDEELLSNSRQHCSLLEAALTQQPFLSGHGFTVADLAVASVAELLRARDFDFSPWPALTRWLQTCLTRPGRQQTGERQWVW